MGALHGIYSGLVVDNLDPEQLARVLVRIPEWDDPGRDIWARLVTMMAGADCGTYFVPDIGDEVLVAFHHGDARAAYVLGAMWNSIDRPPAQNESPSNVKLIRTRSGVTLQIFDDGNTTRLTIATPGGQRITLDDDPGTVRVEDANGNHVTLSPTGVSVAASATVQVAAALVEIDAGMLTVHAPVARFDGVVQCETLVTNSVVSASYTPGAGNVW